MKKKIIFLTIFCLAFYGALIPNIAQALNSTLYLAPASGSHQVGNNFNVEIRLDTKGQTVLGAKAYINFPANLSVVNSKVSEIGSAFSAGIVKNKVVGNQIQLEAGSLSGLSGSNLLVGTITFNALSSGTANVSFDDSCEVSGENGSNVLGSSQGGAYLIQGAVNQPSLKLNPLAGIYKTNDSFDIKIMLNTADEYTDGVDVHYLRFDPDMLKVVKITPGALYANTDKNNFDNNLGLVNFSQTTQGGVTYKGSGILAIITFQSLAVGDTEANFDFAPGVTTDCNIYKAGGSHTDILSSVAGGAYSVSNSGPRQKKIKLEIFPEAKKILSNLSVIIYLYKNNGQTIMDTIASKLDASGFLQTLIDLSSFEDENWDLKIKVPYYLVSLKKVALNQNVAETSVEAILLAGDLNNDNEINEIDWSVMGPKWFTSDAVSDINGDGAVNSLDWHYINKNWEVKGN